MTTQTAGIARKIGAVVAMMAMGTVIPYLAAYAAYFSSLVLHTPSPRGPTLAWLYSQHGFQLVLALIAIAFLKRLVSADYGLHLPRGKTYVGAALLWGAFFGVVMTLVDYALQIIAGTAPKLGYPLNAANVGGWLFFEGVYVGPTEEIPFRSLLVTYLAAMLPSRLRVGGTEMGWAGIIVALVFALAHVANFWTRPWPLALGQQLYAFALGVLYAYWLDKSKSVLAPMIGHNTSDFVEYALVFLWVGFA